MDQNQFVEMMCGDSMKKLLALRGELKQKEEEVKELEARIAVNETVREALVGLTVSWKERDPGKHRPAYFFRGKKGQRVVLQDILPGGTLSFNSWPDWNLYLIKRNYPPYYDAISPNLSVCNWEDLLMVDCPNCGKQHPFIEKYEQTLDAPEYDEWEKCEYVICDGQLVLLKKATSKMRF